MKDKIKLLILIIILILISVLLLIKPNISPDLTIPYKTNIFHIDTNENTTSYLRDYLLEYNFENQKGSLSFRTYILKETDISISLPNIMNITNMDIFNKDTNKTFQQDQICNNYGFDISCHFNFSGELTFSINFSSSGKDKFYPNGLFLLQNTRFPDSTGFDSGEFNNQNILLRFNLGDKYKCNDPCFIKEIGNKNLNYYLEKSNLLVYVTPGSEYEDISFSRIRLNTYDYQKEKNSGIGLALGISLISGLILILLEIIAGINYSKRKDIINFLKNLFKT